MSELIEYKKALDALNFTAQECYRASKAAPSDLYLAGYADGVDRAHGVVRDLPTSKGDALINATATLLRVFGCAEWERLCRRERGEFGVTTARQSALHNAERALDALERRR